MEVGTVEAANNKRETRKYKRRRWKKKKIKIRETDGRNKW